MGFLLKIAIFAIAAYGIWTTANRWFGILGGHRRQPAPPPANPPQAPREKAASRARIVEDTRPCAACGAYVAVGAAKCGRPECPQT